MKITQTQRNFNRQLEPNFKALIKMRSGDIFESTKYFTTKEVGKGPEKLSQFVSETGQTMAILRIELADKLHKVIQWANNYKGPHIIDLTDLEKNQVKLIRNEFAEDLDNLFNKS